MSKTPMVSIIVPVYNASKTLRRCVDSVLKQEYADFELFLVDDGSRDDSGTICDEYAGKDPRVRVIHKANAGVSAARNDALDQARGEYLQFLDSDDWLSPDATRLLVRTAQETQCDLVIADFYRVSGERVSHKGEIDEEGAYRIALRSRGTPRLANRLLKRVRDFAEVKYDGRITAEVADFALDILDVDKLGLDNNDRSILLTIIEKFGGGPVGLDTLSAALGEDSGTIEDVYEPYLLMNGLLQRTPRGRIATENAYRHLGLSAAYGGSCAEKQKKEEIEGQEKLDL